MWIEWPVLSIDLRWPLGLLITLLLLMWLYKSISLHRMCKSNEALQKHFLSNFRPWYIWAQVWLMPVFVILYCFNDDRLPDWLVRLGRKQGEWGSHAE